MAKHRLLLYADDSAILVLGKNKNDIENGHTRDLDNVSQWLNANKLSFTSRKDNDFYLVNKND